MKLLFLVASLLAAITNASEGVEQLVSKNNTLTIVRCDVNKQQPIKVKGRWIEDNDAVWVDISTSNKQLCKQGK